MRTLRILSLLTCSYLTGWIIADMLVPVILTRRGETAIPVPDTGMTASSHSSTQIDSCSSVTRSSAL